jgi:GABA(A) receptor-associated protein
MEEAVCNVKRFFDDRKTYLTRKPSFKEKHSFEKRASESSRILEEYPDRIPVICECLGGEVPDIDRKKYLVPSDLTMAQFLYVIRKRIRISPEKSIYLFVEDSVIVAGSQLIGSVHNKYQDSDGFLYVTYSGENTFG